MGCGKCVRCGICGKCGKCLEHILYFYHLGAVRQVLRLTQKVRRENEPLKTAKLNFTATSYGKFSLRTPCWAHIWIVLHINWDFLMAKRIFIHNSKSNHCQSIFLQFGIYELSPKLEEDFVPNWRKTEMRQLWLQYETETCFCSWYWLLRCVVCQWCAQH